MARPLQSQSKLWLSLWIVGLILCEVLITNTAIAGDPWTYFHPEAVISYECKASPFQLSEHGGDSRPVYEANASAKRKDMNDWGQTLAAFEYHTDKEQDKAADKALEVCRKWRKEASKRIRAAQAR